MARDNAGRSGGFMQHSALVRETWLSWDLEPGGSLEKLEDLMKKLLLAVAALGLMATSVAAQYGPPPSSEFRRPYGPPIGGPPPPYSDYRRPPPPPLYRQPRYVGPPVIAGPPPSWRHGRAYSWCQARAQRLHEFEFRMQQDGRVSRDEVRIARSLRADLAANCGSGRWNPNRGWYYN